MLDKKNDSIPKEQYHLILWLKFVKKTELQYFKVNEIVKFQIWTRILNKVLPSESCPCLEHKFSPNLQSC